MRTDEEVQVWTSGQQKSCRVHTQEVKHAKTETPDISISQCSVMSDGQRGFTTFLALISLYLLLVMCSLKLTPEEQLFRQKGVCTNAKKLNYSMIRNFSYRWKKICRRTIRHFILYECVQLAAFLSQEYVLIYCPFSQRVLVTISFNIRLHCSTH